MNDDRKPPHNVRVLQQWVGALAREQGIAPGRVQRWISFMVVAAMLDHARDENEDPLFLLKGGAALELRLGLKARATKDYDTAYREAIATMLERLDAALRHGFGDFTADRTPPELIAKTGAQRLQIKLGYRGRSWGTVQLEVAAAEGEAGREIDRVPGKALGPLGLTVPADVPLRFDPLPDRAEGACMYGSAHRRPRKRSISRPNRPPTSGGAGPERRMADGARRLRGDLHLESRPLVASDGCRFRFLVRTLRGARS